MTSFFGGRGLMSKWNTAWSGVSYLNYIYVYTKRKPNSCTFEPVTVQWTMCYVLYCNPKYQGTTSLDPWASVNFILLDQRTENKQFINAYWQYLWVFQQAVSLSHPFFLSYCQLLKFTQCILGKKDSAYPIYEMSPAPARPLLSATP